MAVPDNYSFTLGDVRDNVAGAPTTLADAFAVAIDAKFDPAYKGSKNSLRNFRNYNDDGPANTLTVTPSVVEDLDGEAGVYNFTITCNTTWEAEKVSGDAWLGAATPATGSGNGSVTMFKAANTSEPYRTGTLRVRTTSGSPTITRFIFITQYERE